MGYYSGITQSRRFIRSKIPSLSPRMRILINVGMLGALTYYYKQQKRQTMFYYQDKAPTVFSDTQSEKKLTAQNLNTVDKAMISNHC